MEVIQNTAMREAFANASFGRQSQSGSTTAGDMRGWTMFKLVRRALGTRSGTAKRHRMWSVLR